MKNTYYVTTPIYYASGELTVGHCFCTVLADACARYKRLDGYDVMFLTGSDEHGLKIARKAEQSGLTPQEFVDKIVSEFKVVWSRLGISYDKFIRTTDDNHVKLVEKVMNKLYDQGDIYLGSYQGLYCVPCETYFTESQLVDGKCPDCGRPVELAKEDCYFFKLSKYQKFLEELFQDPHFLVPVSRKNEIYNNFVKPGITDLCVTRTSFDWGVRVPFDKKHVVYVWIDALLNYISALGYGSDDDTLFKKYWPADVHFVGRDITRFHTTIWPVLLKALNIPMPKQVHSTGFITLKGDKISKSKSNGFSPMVLCDRYGVDALRYYLIKEGPIFEDIPYTSEVFLNTINADLCNTLGNLVSRVVAMIEQYNGGIVPCPHEFTALDNALIDRCNTLYTEVNNFMNEQRVDEAIKNIFDCLGQANKYVDLTTPWILAKDETQKDRLDTVLYVLQETIRVCTVLLQAYLIEIPHKIFTSLGVTDTSFDSAKKFSITSFGQHVTKGEQIFNRLKVQDELKFLNEAK